VHDDPSEATATHAMSPSAMDRQSPPSKYPEISPSLLFCGGKLPACEPKADSSIVNPDAGRELPRVTNVCHTRADFYHCND